MSSCGIWCSGDGYYNILKNGQVQQLSPSSQVSPENTQQPASLSFENSSSTTHTLSNCIFDGSKMYTIADSSQALYQIQKPGNFSATLFTRDVGFSQSVILPLTNWKDNNNCVYLVNSTGMRPECGSSTSTLSMITDSTIDYANFATAVTASPNIIYRLDSGSELSTITIGNPASIIRSPLQPPLDIKSMTNVTVSLSSDKSDFLVYEIASGTLQVIKSINSTISGSTTLTTGKQQITDSGASGATFYNSNLIIASTGNQYNSVSTSDLFTSNDTTTTPTGSPAISSSSGGRYIDPAVAGGFTVLGLVLGALIVIGIFYLRSRLKGRNKKILIPNEDVLTPVGTKEMLTDTTPLDETMYSQYDPLPRINFEIINLNGPSIEANPMQTSVSPIFLNQCNIQDLGPAQHSSNPHIGAGIYLRECTFNGKPGLIHYIAFANGDQFDNFVQVLNSIQSLPYKSAHMLELYAAYKFSDPTDDDYNIQYTIVTSYYEPKESLARLYKRHKEGTTVVNVKDEVFIICTIYSLLKSVRDVHNAGYTHRHLSIYSFYAESYAPTLDWVLSDFNEATQSNNSDFQNDIYDLGCIIYTVISGGRNFSDDRNLGLVTNMIQEVTQNQTYQDQYRRILDASLNRDTNQRYNADHLLKLWESFFDFKN